MMTYTQQLVFFTDEPTHQPVNFITMIQCDECMFGAKTLQVIFVFIKQSVSHSRIPLRKSNDFCKRTSCQYYVII